MTTHEAIFYSICVICGSGLIAWLWYLAAKSKPVERCNPYEKFIPRRDWSITYKYDDKENQKCRGEDKKES